MSNYTSLYWLTRLDALNTFFILLIVLSIVCTIIYFIVFAIQGEWEKDEVKKALRDRFEKKWKKVPKTAMVLTAMVLTAISSFMLVFLPTKTDVIVIFAGGKAMDFVQKDSSINKIPAQTTKIITDHLDKVIEDLDK